MFEIAGTALATNLDGRLELLATVARDGRPDAVWHRYEGLEGYWTDWQSLGKPGGGARYLAPTVTQNHLGCLEVAVVSDDGTVWQAEQRHPGRQWTDWQSLGIPSDEPEVHSMTTPVLTRNHDGRLELFVGAWDGKLWHRWQTKSAGGPWSPWSSLGTPSDSGVREVAAAQNHNGRLGLFVLAHNGTMWHRGQTEAGRPWLPWSALGTPKDHMPMIHAPAVGRNQDGRLELCMRAADQDVWHRWETKAGAGTWSRWSPLGRPAGESDEIAVGAHADGRLVLVASSEASDGVAVSRTEQTAPNDGWSGWAPLETEPKPRPSTTRDPTLALDAEGRLQAFLRIPETVQVYWLSQRSPNGGEWRGRWLNPPPPPESAEPAPPNNQSH